MSSTSSYSERNLDSDSSETNFYSKYKIDPEPDSENNKSYHLLISIKYISK